MVGEWPAVAGSVREAREAVVGLARAHGASAAEADMIRLAISEAASNVVMHAYPDQPLGDFRVLAVVGDGQLLVTVEDDGRGLNAPSATPGLGEGLRLMRRIADQALFREREFGGSTVQLRFALASPRRESFERVPTRAEVENNTFGFPGVADQP